MKFKQGAIRTYEGIERDVIVSSPLTVETKDLAIGAILIVCGIVHLMRSAFKNGAKCHDEAELETLTDLGLIGK